MRPTGTVVATVTLLAALGAAAGGAAAGERSYGFIHVSSNGGISQSLYSRPSSRSVSVSGGSERREAYRPARSDRSERRQRSGERFQPRGSFVYVSSGAEEADRPYIPALDDVAYGGSGTYGFNSDEARGYRGGYFGDRPAPNFPSEPKIIHIESERLDRRPIGPSGIEVISNGGPKIIRIAPGYSSSGKRLASADAPRQKASPAYLQPWTEAWSKHCRAAFGSFNPELGTYRDSAGMVRFCTADE